MEVGELMLSLPHQILGWGGGDSHIKRTGVLVVPVRDWKLGLVPLRVFSLKRCCTSWSIELNKILQEIMCCFRIGTSSKFPTSTPVLFTVYGSDTVSNSVCCWVSNDQGTIWSMFKNMWHLINLCVFDLILAFDLKGALIYLLLGLFLVRKRTPCAWKDRVYFQKLFSFRLLQQRHLSPLLAALQRKTGKLLW